MTNDNDENNINDDNADGYEAGDIRTDALGQKWLKMGNGKWAFMFDFEADDDNDDINKDIKDLDLKELIH